MPEADGAKRKRGMETIEKVLEEAARLFAHKGFDNVSTREIAAAVGIKDSSLYNHFKSKADILTTLFHRFAATVPASHPSEQEVDELISLLPPGEVLKHLIIRYGRGITVTLNNTARTVYSEMFRNPAAGELFGEVILADQKRFFTLVFQKMIAQGQLRPSDAGDLAELWNNALTCLTMQYAMAEPGTPQAITVAQKMMRMADFFCSMAK